MKKQYVVTLSRSVEIFTQVGVEANSKREAEWRARCMASGGDLDEAPWYLSDEPMDSGISQDGKGFFLDRKALTDLTYSVEKESK